MNSERLPSGANFSDAMICANRMARDEGRAVQICVSEDGFAVRFWGEPEPPDSTVVGVVFGGMRNLGDRMPESGRRSVSSYR